MINNNFKKYLAEMIEKDTGMDTPVERITSINTKNEIYVVSIKNSCLEEGYSEEFITQHDVLAHIIDKLESQSP